MPLCSASVGNHWKSPGKWNYGELEALEEIHFFPCHLTVLLVTSHFTGLMQWPFSPHSG